MDEFEYIYRSYYHDILYFLQRLTGYDYQLAEELTQECFYQAYISIERFKGKCAIKT